MDVDAGGAAPEELGSAVAGAPTQRAVPPAASHFSPILLPSCHPRDPADAKSLRVCSAGWLAGAANHLPPADATTAHLSYGPPRRLILQSQGTNDSLNSKSEVSEKHGEEKMMIFCR